MTQVFLGFCFCLGNPPKCFFLVSLFKTTTPCWNGFVFFAGTLQRVFRLPRQSLKSASNLRGGPGNRSPKLNPGRALSPSRSICSQVGVKYFSTGAMGASRGSVVIRKLSRNFLCCCFSLFLSCPYSKWLWVKTNGTILG